MEAKWIVVYQHIIGDTLTFLTCGKSEVPDILERKFNMSNVLFACPIEDFTAALTGCM